MTQESRDNVLIKKGMKLYGTIKNTIGAFEELITDDLRLFIKKNGLLEVGKPRFTGESECWAYMTVRKGPATMPLELGAWWNSRSLPGKPLLAIYVAVPRGYGYMRNFKYKVRPGKIQVAHDRKCSYLYIEPDLATPDLYGNLQLLWDEACTVVLPQSKQLKVND